MKDLLFFDTMLTPRVITVVYWLLLISVVLSGLYTMFAVTFLGGLFTIIGGVIGVRIWCELLIVIFKIHENLMRIANKQE